MNDNQLSRLQNDKRALVEDKNREWDAICDWLDRLPLDQLSALRRMKPPGMVGLRLSNMAVRGRSLAR